MTPLDLRTYRPRSPRETMLGYYFLARTVDKLRAELPGGNVGPFLNHDTGFSAYVVRRLGLDMDEFREAVARAPDEAAVEAWLAERIDPAAAPALNAKVESFVVERMTAEDQALVRERHPVMALRPDLSKILDILDADDEHTFAGYGASSSNQATMHDVTDIHPIGLPEIEAARERIAGTILRTPLVRLDVGPEFPEIYLKLENLQPTNSFKIRGAANAVACIPEALRARGVWTISAGNAGQGVAYAARQAGIPCTVVTIDTAPETKIERMRALGATLVRAPFDACWEAMGSRSFPGVSGTFVHPFDDDAFVAGNASMGLEILEDLPNVALVITAIGGGGLIAGAASGIKAKAPHVRVLGAEPETGAPASVSFANGAASTFDAWQVSFVDGAGGKSVFPRMWQRFKDIVDGSIVVSLDETRRAMRVLAEKARVIAEGAGALSVAAALSGRVKSDGPIVAVVSGGNVDLAKFADLIGAK